MKKQTLTIGGIPAVVWGESSERAYLYVHGKQSCKEAAGTFAGIAAEKGFQTVSFDLPGHGERDKSERCDVWNGTRDLRTVADHVFGGWKEVSLFACSLGAYLSLNELPGRSFGNCLFKSPIVDMGYLVGQMMNWFGITPERLEKEREIDTPVDLMTWDYYNYVLTHPTDKWPHPTHILYGRRDDLQSAEVMERFARENGAQLTVSEVSGHAFMEEGDDVIAHEWVRSSI